MRVDQAGNDGSSFGVNALGLRSEEGGGDFLAHEDELTVFDGEGYRFGLLCVNGIDIGVFDDEVRDLSASQRSERQQKRH